MVLETECIARDQRVETALVQAVMRWAESVSLQDSFRLFTCMLDSCALTTCFDQS